MPRLALAAITKRFDDFQAVDGVSLTVNEVEGARFGICVIPHTQHATNFGGLRPGEVKPVPPFP